MLFRSMSLGIVMAFSASIYVALHNFNGDESHFLVRHLSHAGIALFVMLVAIRVPYQIWRPLAYPLLLTALTACGPSYSPDTYASTAMQQASKVEKGTIVGVRPARVSASAEAPAAGGELGDRLLQVLDRSVTMVDAFHVADDVLRQIPTFSLFRRTSSLSSHPTTQGVSLRGIGPSGVSRTLVMLDGVPFNDPFGGWVYWTRFSPDELDRIEVVRGASTSVFGDRAIGGSIQLFSRPEEPWRLRGAYEGGNKNTHQLTGGFSHLKPRWAFSTDARLFRTDGFYLIEQGRRGAADNEAGVHFAAGDVRLDYLGAKDRFFVKCDALTEDRANGTVLTRNSTSLGNISGQYFREFGKDNLSLTGWHGQEEFHASFSTVAANRQTERLTMRQQVPADVTGAAIEAMVGLGADPARMRAVVGPAICGACYAVPQERVDAVARVVPEAAAIARDGQPALDIRAGVTAGLARAGISTLTVGGCTAEGSEWFSYRRDGRTGRHGGLIALAGAAEGES